MTNPEPLSKEEREELMRIIERGETVTLLDVLRYEATVRDMEVYILAMETQVSLWRTERMIAGSNVGDALI